MNLKSRLEHLERNMALSRGGELTDAQRMRRYEDLRAAAECDPAARARFTAGNNLLARAARLRASEDRRGRFYISVFTASHG